jgi:type II secretory pathway component PulF
LSIRINEIIAFCQQLANLIKAGIPLITALTALAAQEENPKFKTIINSVLKDIEEGLPLSEAFGKFPQVFSHFFIGMLYAGEQGAGLSMVLDRIANQIEKENDLKTKIKRVFTYPMIVSILCAIVITFLIVFVTPIFAGVYTKLGVTLPIPTKILLAISYITRKFWWLIIILISLVSAAYYYIKRTEVGKDGLSWLKINFPIFGPFIRKVYIGKFLRLFSDLLICNVPLTDALFITNKVINNRLISNMINNINNSIQAGGTITAALIESNIFSQVVIQMAYAGEETNSLGPMFEICANNMNTTIEDSAKKIITLLEPILTIAIAGIVAFIALAIYLPMFDIMSQMS